MPDKSASIKDPEHEAENPASMPEGSIRKQQTDDIKGPEKPTDRAGQQGGTEGGGRG
jgi:hypothetical protein